MACIFCEIAAKRAPAQIVYEDDELMAFHDIHPQAPIHVLLIPKIHIPTVNDLEASHALMMGQLFLLAKKLAAQWQLVAPGYRLRVHVGRGGGQIVDHVHMHLLSGQH
ncbi:MAG: histidine triad nucleotide-binding protein [Candidatus Tectimicrobiota bacterium]